MPAQYIIAPRQLTALAAQAKGENLTQHHPVVQMLSHASFYGGIGVYYLPPSADAETEFLRVAGAAGFTPATTDQKPPQKRRR